MTLVACPGVQSRKLNQVGRIIVSSQYRLVIIPGGGSVTGGQCHLREVVIGSRVSLVQRERAFEGCIGLVRLARFLVDLAQQIVGCNAGGGRR